MRDLMSAGRAFLDALDSWPASAADRVLDLANLPHTEDLRHEAEIRLRAEMLAASWELSDALERLDRS